MFKICLNLCLIKIASYTNINIALSQLDYRFALISVQLGIYCI